MARKILLFLVIFEDFLPKTLFIQKKVVPLWQQFPPRLLTMRTTVGLRFACYLQPFEIDSATHQYAVGTSFDQIIELYQFDKELRSLIFTAIQDVEIALRSRIIHHFSMSHGTFWFLNRNMFKDKSIFNTTL